MCSLRYGHIYILRYIMIHHGIFWYTMIRYDASWQPATMTVAIIIVCPCGQLIVILWSYLFSQGLELPKGHGRCWRVVCRLLMSSWAMCFSKSGSGCIYPAVIIHSQSHKDINRVHSFTSDTCPFPACLDSCDKLMFDRNVLVIPKAKATCCHRDSPRPPVFLSLPAFWPGAWYFGDPNRSLKKVDLWMAKIPSGNLM